MTVKEFNTTVFADGTKVFYRGKIHEVQMIDLIEIRVMINNRWVSCEAVELVMWKVGERICHNDWIIFEIIPETKTYKAVLLQPSIDTQYNAVKWCSNEGGRLPHADEMSLILHTTISREDGGKYCCLEYHNDCAYVQHSGIGTTTKTGSRDDLYSFVCVREYGGDDTDD